MAPSLRSRRSVSVYQPFEQSLVDSTFDRTHRNPSATLSNDGPYYRAKHNTNFRLSPPPVTGASSSHPGPASRDGTTDGRNDAGTDGPANRAPGNRAPNRPAFHTIPSTVHAGVCRRHHR